jgi:hypothetical protein
MLRSCIGSIILGVSKVLFLLHLKSEAVLRGLFDLDSGGTTTWKSSGTIYDLCSETSHLTWTITLALWEPLNSVGNVLQKLQNLVLYFVSSNCWWSLVTLCGLIVHFWKYLHDWFLRATYFRWKYGGRI